MKKRVKSAIALLSALATLSCGALSASAGNLTKEQLIEKYGYRCNITDQVTIGSNEKWAAFEIKDAGANISETIASGVENGICYDELADGSVCITGLDFDAFPLDATVLTIPEEIHNKPVKVIGSNAFQKLYRTLPELREIILPDSIEIISDYAFDNVFCDFKTSRSMTKAEKAPYRINLPKNVVFIDYMAFAENGFSIVNAQQQNHVLTLPESLEYISSYAFSGEIGSRVYGLIEVDMPDSPVFMSDTTFHSWSIFRTRMFICSSVIEANTHNVVFADDIPTEDLPLLQSVFNSGFLNGECNIVSMVDMFRDYIQEHNLDVEYHDYIQTIDYYDMYTSPDGTHLAIDYYQDLAARNAPDLLNAATKPAPAVTLLGDVNLDDAVNIKDAVLISRMVAEDAAVTPLVPGAQNADINQDNLVTADDVMTIVQKLCFK